MLKYSLPILISLFTCTQLHAEKTDEQIEAEMKALGIEDEGLGAKDPDLYDLLDYPREWGDEKKVKKYEKEFLARHKKRQKTWSKKKVSIPLRQIEDLGRFSFREHVIVKREEYLAERKEYEQKYLHRCMKTQNDKPKRSSSKKLDLDLISGRLNLREHVEEKRKEIQAERGEYEKKYLSRYKETEPKLKKSKPSKEHNEDLGRLNFREHVVTKREKLQAERDEYEKKYVARYLKQQKSKQKKKK